MEGESGRDRVEHGGECGASGRATLTLDALDLGDVLEQAGGATEAVLGAGEHDAAAAVAQVHDDACRCRQVGQCGPDALRALAGDTQHRVAEQSTSTSDDLGGGTDQARVGKQLGLGVRGGGCGERLGGDESLRVPDDGNRPDVARVEALALERAETGELGEQDARQGGGRRCQEVSVRQVRGGGVVVGLVGVGAGLSSGVGPRERRERDAGPHEVGSNGCDERVGLLEQRLQLVLEREITHESGERLEPRSSLTPERDGIRGAVDDAVDEGLAALCCRGGGWGRVNRRHTTIIAKREGNLNFYARVSSCFSVD